MNKILTIDIGNTNTAIGIFSEQGRLEFCVSLPADKIFFGQSENGALSLALKSLCAQPVSGAVISSVAPQLTEKVCAAAKKYVSGQTLLPEQLRAAFKVKNYNAENLGTDRMADVTAALAFYGAPAAVFDFGTASVFSAADGSGAFIGGMITPGITLSLDALAGRAALLPKITPGAHEGFLGRDTKTSMQNGVLYAAAAFADEMTARLEERLSCSLTPVITGGAAEAVMPLCRRKTVYDKNLLLKGLYIMYKNIAG